jgi:hypothetical protein
MAFQSLMLAAQAPAASGIALVQQAVGTSATGVLNVDLGTNPVIGNSLILCLSYLSTDGLDGNPSFGGSDTATLAASSTVAGVTVDIWYAHDILDDPHAEAFTVGGTRLSGSVSEWSGLANSVPVRTTNNAVGSATVSTNPVTPATANNLVIAIGGWTANNYSSGPTNSFVRMTATGGGAAWQETAYKIQTSAVDAETGWTLTLPINWTTVIAAFDGA